MKRFYTLAISFFSLVVANAQEKGNVGIGTSSPDESAVLEIKSADKGLLIPRMTQEQISTIANPAKGLLVFQTDGNNSGFFFYNGEKWSPLSGGEANSVATMDINGWSLSGNASATPGIKAAATESSFIGTPSTVSIQFKVGSNSAGRIDPYSKGGVFFGTNSGTAMSSGTNNIGLGTFALNKMTVGGSNLAVGNEALKKNLDGSFNVAIGALSLTNGEHGKYNLAIGARSLENATGDYNTAIGTWAGQNSTGEKNTFIGYQAGQNETLSNKLYIANSSTITPLIYGDFSAKFISIGDIEPIKRNTIAQNGSYGLLVEKGILTEKIKVALKNSGSDWSDYVFEPEYKANMMSLEEVEAFTIENKHLPNVPSAEEMVSGGLDVAETSRVFMEKIEELTLYLIDLNKEVKELKKENELLKSKVK